MPQIGIDPAVRLHASPARWTIELFEGWCAEARVDDNGWEQDEYVAITPPTGDSLLRLTVACRSTHTVSPEQWVGFVGMSSRAMGRPVVPVRFGVFTGYATCFKSGNEWLRGWALRAGSLGLDATYRCPVELASRDDVMLEVMLATLYVRGLP